MSFERENLVDGGHKGEGEMSVNETDRNGVDLAQDQKKIGTDIIDCSFQTGLVRDFPKAKEVAAETTLLKS
jgi:hypothetical protein